MSDDTKNRVEEFNRLTQKLAQIEGKLKELNKQKEKLVEEIKEKGILKAIDEVSIMNKIKELREIREKRLKKIDRILRATDEQLQAIE